MQNIGGDDGLPNTKCNVEDLQQVSETAAAEPDRIRHSAGLVRHGTIETSHMGLPKMVYPQIQVCLPKKLSLVKLPIWGCFIADI